MNAAYKNPDPAHDPERRRGSDYPHTASRELMHPIGETSEIQREEPAENEKEKCSWVYCGHCSVSEIDTIEGM